MNPELAGYTHEGLPVAKDDMVDLAFVPFCFEWNGLKPSFSLAVEFNKTPTGKRRPYLALQLFGLLIQSGWLF
jgi:hypothetical protein